MFWAVALVILAVDLASKSWAFETLSEGTARIIWPGVLQFRLLENPGAVFGIGGGRRMFFIVASIIAMVFVYHLFATSTVRQRFLHGMLALIIGGAGGNLYDRLLLGHVRDFVNVSIRIADVQIWPWVFNLADAALVVGVLAIGIGWLANHHAVAFHAAVVDSRPGAGKADNSTQQDEELTN